MAEDGTSRASRQTRPRRSPIVTRGDPTTQPTIAPYFLEEVRKELESRVRREAALRERSDDPDRARSPVAGRRQPRARDGLRRIDHLHGFRKPRRNILDERHTIEAFKHPRWDRPFAVNDVVPAVVVDVDGTRHPPARRRPTCTIDKKGYAWTRKTPAQLVARGRPCGDQAADDRSGRAHGDGVARSAAAGRGCGPGDRQPHGPDHSNGRRLQLRSEQVQPGRPGVPAGRIGVQAFCLHGRDRSRLYADDDPGGRAGHASLAAPGQPPYSPQNYDHKFEGPSRCAARSSIAQRPRGSRDGRARARSRSSPTRAASASTRRCRRTCRSRSAPAKRRCSR